LQWGDEIRAFDRDNRFVLDIGAGTGALTTTLTFKYPALRVLAADISPGMLKAIEEKHLPSTETVLLNASELNGPLGTRTLQPNAQPFHDHVLAFAYECSSGNTLRSETSRGDWNRSLGRGEWADDNWGRRV
jgi:trans-aconitate methyltransferase